MTERKENMKQWDRIEEAVKMLHARLEVPEHKARCTLAHRKDGTRIVVQRLSDGMSASEFVRS